ncbi:MAG: small, acid-soluble spore protein, alpha/beta type [Firmicutes bacterium]|nr:small, acid-soluble spore protein, alpha/beta type [Bacillota bacterium]
MFRLTHVGNANHKHTRREVGLVAKKKKNKERQKAVRDMDRLKFETAEQLGLSDDLRDPDELTVREAGKVGGAMVRKLVKKGKQAIAKETSRRPEKNL